MSLLDALSEQYDRRQILDLLRRIEQRLGDLERRPPGDSYTVSNADGTRTIDADAATTNQVRDILATLISDLKTRGVIP